jgi:hypothetical protein
MADSTTNLDTISQTQSAKETTANALFDAASPASVYGRRAATCSGLTWGYYGGRWGGSTIAEGTQVLGTSTTTYMVVLRTTGAVSFSTSATNWNNTATYARAYKLVTGASSVTSYEDHRAGTNGTQHAGGTTAITGLVFTSDTDSTTDADPGAGLFKWNHATQASATALYVDNADADGITVTTFFASLGSTGFIYLQQADDRTKWQMWKWSTAPTAGSGYYKFTSLVLQAQGGSIADAKSVYTEWLPAPVSSLVSWTDATTIASPNNVTGAASLLAVSSLSTADAVLSPKSTGAVQAHVADSSSTGGNKRGAGAVDWQTTRSAATQVASGARAVIVGGSGNTASSNTSFVGSGTSNTASTGTNAAVVGGQANTATGDNAFIGGGGGSGVGNTASGIASGVGAGISGLASGHYSFIGGGEANTASEYHSSVVSGVGCTANGVLSISGGSYSHAMGLRGVDVRSAGRFGVNAHSQRVEMFLRIETTDATQTALTADGSTVSATNQLVLLNSSAYVVEGMVVARENATGDTTSWTFTCAIRRGANAAATAMVAACTPTLVAADAGAATWALAVDADATNGALRLRFTGEAAHTIRTSATLRATQTVL